MKNQHNITKDFESALSDYTGAPYAVAVTSCTMALLLAVAWHLSDGAQPEWATYPGLPLPNIEIPKHTYISVPMSIIHAGGRPIFRDDEWVGAYRLKPLPVVDSARYFTSGMYQSMPGMMICLSFHASKTLGDTQGGAILHDNPEADKWLRRARFDGRTEGIPPNEDSFDMIGWHCYMSPDVAARLLFKLSALPKHNVPLPNDAYPDLSQMEIFK